MPQEKEELFQNKYRIKSHRHPAWNYADEGWYFVTICTKDRICHFGNIVARDVETQDFASLHNEYRNTFGPQSKNLSSVVRGYKAAVKKYATMHNINFAWQPRFYDRIVRDEHELSNIRTYIVNNPIKWKWDKNNPGYL